MSAGYQELMTQQRILQFLRSGLPAQQLYKVIKKATADPEMQLTLINAIRVYADHQKELKSRVGPFGNKSNVAAAEAPRPLAKLLERLNRKE